MFPTRSPFQLKELAFQTRFAAELLKAYNAFMATMPQIKATIAEARTLSKEARDQFTRVQNLPKGEKGDSVRGPQGIPGVKGADGKTPVKGQDYFTESDIQEVAERASVLVLTPEDGKDATVDYDFILDELVDRLKKEGYSKDTILDMKNEMASYRNRMAMKQAGQHGGGTTVAAGSGITLTPNADGTTTIASTGGGVSYETPVGAVDDSNVTFTVTNDPQYLIINGSQNFVGTGIYASYDTVTNTITLSAPVGAGGFIRSAY